MDFRQLKYFVAVAEAGTMAGAARTLFVTQPTLTVALRKLEKSLGTDLLDRSTNPITLTEAGQYLFKEGSKILESVDHLAERVHELGASTRSRLRVGLTVLFTMQFMPQISTFMANHPEIEVSLIQCGSRELQQRLVAGELDCGVVSFPNYEPDVEITPLTGQYSSYRAAVVMRADNPLATRTSLTYGDLRNERFSSLSHGYVLGEMLAERCRAYDFSPEVVFVNDSWTVLVSSIPQLNSVAILPMELKDVTNQSEVVWIPLDDKVSHLPIGIGLLKAQPRAPGLTELITLLRTPAATIAHTPATHPPEAAGGPSHPPYTHDDAAAH